MPIADRQPCVRARGALAPRRCAARLHHDVRSNAVRQVHDVFHRVRVSDIDRVKADFTGLGETQCLVVGCSDHD